MLRATRKLPVCKGLCRSFSSNSQRSESFDGTCKVATMNIGLEDTLACYSPEEFSVGFKKTMAFQPRVIKQNRASSGAFGSSDWGVRTAARSMARGRVRMVRSWCSWRPMTTMRRSTAGFIEFCMHGRTDKSGEWTSKDVAQCWPGLSCRNLWSSPKIPNSRPYLGSLESM